MKKKAATKKNTKQSKPKKKAVEKVVPPKNTKPKGPLAHFDLNKVSRPWLEKFAKQLSVAQEAFCQLITDPGSDTYNNGTVSYAGAYGYDLDSYDTEDAEYVDTLNADGEKTGFQEKVRPSSRDIAENVCAAAASRLLRNVKIAERIIDLQNKKILKNKVVDARLAKWITDDREPATSMRAIAEYNKLHNRVKDVIELRGPAPLKAQKEAHKAALAKIARKNG